jgi:hypothetical protein
MLDEKWVILGAALSFIGIVSYLADTLKGKAKPNKVTWFLWALAPLIAFSAEISQGVGLQSLMTFIVGFGPLLVFLASFINKRAYWQIKKLDIVCGSLSILGLILWQLTQIGNLAILFSIFADGLAAVPTVIKSWTNPETESSTIFLLSAINALITLMTITVWNFELYAFPVYILLIDVLLYVIIQFKPGKTFARKTSL